jgi:hypothetical protein
VIETVPILSKAAETVSPGPNGTAAHTEPGRIMCPGSQLNGPLLPGTTRREVRLK